MYSLKECDFHPALKELSDKVPRNMSSQSEIVKHNEQGTMSESQLETTADRPVVTIESRIITNRILRKKNCLKLKGIKNMARE